jgi:alpha-beta hydrolase superfamily lysophospholipase
MWELAMRFSETRMDVLKTKDGLNLDIHIWEPETPKAVLLAIHGALVHAGDYEIPALYFKEKGIATVAIDMRGHKQDKIYIKNFELYVEDTNDFLQWTQKAYPDIPIFVMGHSMGGLIATHLGIKYAANEPRIKGYIISSPYYENAIKVPPIMIPLIKIFSKIIPKAVIPGPDLTDLLTRDKALTDRHRKDAEIGLRSLKPTMRFGAELLKAQKWVKENFSSWNHPTFAVVAGADQVADYKESERQFKSMDPKLITYLFHKDNYHENFFEINRQETFDKIYEWIGKVVTL